MKYGLIGKSISYSLSPLLHNLIAENSGYKLNYEIIDIKEQQLKDYINKLKKGLYKGFNITVPYKETIIKYLDKLTPQAKYIGSVNTIYIDNNNNVVGDNTDYFGFSKLIEEDNVLKDVKKVYILGTGGAAKTVFHNLKERNLVCINVSRTGKREEPFNKVITYEDFKKIQEIDLLINCTPVGTFPSKEVPIILNNQKINIVVDLIYNPLETELMKLANKSYNGLNMLIYQAISAQSLFIENNKTYKNKLVNSSKKSIIKIKEALTNELIRQTI